jgi:hypothetical protein
MIIDANPFPYAFYMRGATRWVIDDESSARITPHDHSSHTQQTTTINHN